MKRSLMALSLLGAVASTVLLGGCPEDKPATPPPPVVPPAPATPPPAANMPPGTPTGTPAPAATGEKGTVKGTVAFAGKPMEMGMINRAADAFCNKTKMKEETEIVNANKTLKNVLVRVTNVTGTFPASPAPAEIKQDQCMYRPRVQGIVAGQTIAIKNGDATLHNVHTYKGATTLFNQAQIAGSPAIEKKFSDAGAVLKFKCDVHPWMTGYVAVSANPFFAVTGDDGSFEIKDVPAGKYTVEAWHEKLGTKTAEVTVAAAAPAEAKFSYDGTEQAK